MGTPLQDQNRRVLDALEEGQVTAVIQLDDRGYFMNRGECGRERIASVLVDLGMKADAIEYWLDHFGF